MPNVSKPALACLIILGIVTKVDAQSLDTKEIKSAMRLATNYYVNEVANHGGYVYHYSLDLSERWGEGVATKDQIWVQPPGTPTVGMALLDAYIATGDKFYLDAATRAATALIYGQLKSGGWTNKVDFDPRSSGSADYRNGEGRGKNNSSLDDDQTSAAIRFLIRADAAHEFQHSQIHEAVGIALNALLDAQYNCGAFPQVWTQPVPQQPSTAASYPSYDWRTDGRIKNYWDMYTINDNVTGNVTKTLILAYKTYGGNRYLEAVKRLGDFLILAQMPQPQPGWAQQYSYEMKPIWARRFEPPAVSGDETQEVLETLILLTQFSRDTKYLKPVKSAVAWLKKSKLPNGRIARYYELKTNRPLYMSRKGKEYSLTYDDSNLPDHYGWNTEARIEDIELMVKKVKGGKPLEPIPSGSERQEQVSRVLSSLDSKGRWISTYDGIRLVGQPKMTLGEKYLSSQVFCDNLSLLSRFAEQNHD